MKKSEKIKVCALQTLGTLDGPGVRCVIFLQGCPLRCRYCHNPDTWNMEGGKEYTCAQLAGIVEKYRNYYAGTGGVTVSGGEPLLQAGRLVPFFERMREKSIHTALDTSGCLWNEDVRRLLSCVDLCLLDIKHTERDAYEKLTGGGRLEDTLFFLDILERLHIDTWVRQVVADGLNDTEREIEALKELISEYDCIKKVELLGFSTLCRTKYEAMGIDFPMNKTPDMNPTKLVLLQKKLEAR